MVTDLDQDAQSDRQFLLRLLCFMVSRWVPECTGELLGEHSGASKSKLLTSLDRMLSDWDNPLSGANAFKKQVFSSRLIGSGPSGGAGA